LQVAKDSNVTSFADDVSGSYVNNNTSLMLYLIIRMNRW